MSKYTQNNKNLMRLEAKENRKSKRATTQLHNVLESAELILKENPHVTYERQHPIFSYIKIFTDLIQSKLVTNVIMNGRDNVYSKSYQFFNTVEAYMHPLDKIYLKEVVTRANIYTKIGLNVSIQRDPIVTHLWNADRLADALRNIGSGVIINSFFKGGIQRENKFEYDKLNHKGKYMYPLGVINVYNGNHSISAGLNKSEGNIIIDDLVDVSYLYDIYEFNGRYLINKETKEKEKIYFEFGALFEIGRLLLEHKEVFPEAVLDVINNKEPFKYSYM
ncbi:DUF6710 family protein [Staphylococcus aureus]|uniref:DUF6710 family protein n=1 Tax=Staphylococcus aureus TaxID=1280 RepID=UPI001BFDBE24|nr:DUF6710 family protein [Staphylococcus aureus]